MYHYPYNTLPPAYEPQQKLTIQEKIGILEELRYGDDWGQVKKQILAFQYDYDGHNEQESYVRYGNIGEREEKYRQIQRDSGKDKRREKGKQSGQQKEREKAKYQEEYYGSAMMPMRDNYMYGGIDQSEFYGNYDGYERDKVGRSKNKEGVNVEEHIDYGYGYPQYYNYPPYAHPPPHLLPPHLPPPLPIPPYNTLYPDNQQPTPKQKKYLKKNINYRLQIKGSKKTITQSRLSQKYLQSLQAISSQPSTNTNLKQQKHQPSDPYFFPRYFEPYSQTCRKCFHQKHQSQYCLNPNFCMICLEKNHQSKNCPYKQICLRCYEIGHKKERCYRDDSLLEVCWKCQRKHITSNSGSGNRLINNNCYSLTKGNNQSQGKQVYTDDIDDWSEIRCMRCQCKGHLICQ